LAVGARSRGCDPQAAQLVSSPQVHRHPVRLARRAGGAAHADGTGGGVPAGVRGCSAVDRFAGHPRAGKTTLLSCTAAELDPALRVVVAEEVFRGRRPAAQRRPYADPRRPLRPRAGRRGGWSRGSCAWRPTWPSSARSGTATRCRCCSRWPAARRLRPFDLEVGLQRQRLRRPFDACGRDSCSRAGGPDLNSPAPAHLLRVRVPVRHAEACQHFANVRVGRGG
jgi:hypothetical protein